MHMDFLLVTVLAVFGQNGKDAKISVLQTTVLSQVITTLKSWYEKWPKGMQDTEGAGNLIQTQFQEGKTAAIIDGPWKASSPLRMRK